MMWFFGTDENSWDMYDEADATLLESALSMGLRTITLDEVYECDLINMVQRNLDTDTVRRIYRGWPGEEDASAIPDMSTISSESESSFTEDSEDLSCLLQSSDDPLHLSNEVPHSFVCPLSWEIMKDPVMTATGATYEKSQITQWLLKNSRDPMTNQELDKKTLVPNQSLKKAIEQWRAQWVATGGKID